MPDPSLPQTYKSIADIRQNDSYLPGIEFDRLIDGLRKAGLPEE